MPSLEKLGNSQKGKIVTGSNNSTLQSIENMCSYRITPRMKMIQMLAQLINGLAALFPHKGVNFNECYNVTFELRHKRKQILRFHYAK